MPDTRKPTNKEAERLKREMERERKRRDKAVNNKRSRSPGSHRPTKDRSRRDIMNELT